MVPLYKREKIQNNANYKALLTYEPHNKTSEGKKKKASPTTGIINYFK